MSLSTTYLLLGHPAWRSGLQTHDEESARQWVNEHSQDHPVYVDKVVAERTRLVTSAFRAESEREGLCGALNPNRPEEHCTHVIGHGPIIDTADNPDVIFDHGNGTTSAWTQE